jgi:nitrogen PTS system EIIA component
MIYLKDYLLKDKIHFLDSDTKKDVIETMTASMESVKNIKNFGSFQKAVFEREKILSTGIGNGVAIPHVKMKDIEKFFISIGIVKKGVEWDSIDNNPVNLVFLIGGPDNHELYLQILSKLFLRGKNMKVRDRLLASKTPGDVVEIFKKY